MGMTESLDHPNMAIKRSQLQRPLTASQWAASWIDRAHCVDTEPPCVRGAVSPREREPSNAQDSGDDDGTPRQHRILRAPTSPLLARPAAAAMLEGAPVGWLVVGLLSAVRYLHDNHVVHGAIGPLTVLVDGDHVYLTHWDHAQALEDGVVAASCPIQPKKWLRRLPKHGLRYLAPETLRSQAPVVSPLTDIWSIGAFMYYLKWHDNPASHLSDNQFVAVVRNPETAQQVLRSPSTPTAPPPLSHSQSPYLVSIMRGCTTDPWLRHSVEEILSLALAWMRDEDEVAVQAGLPLDSDVSSESSKGLPVSESPIPAESTEDRLQRLLAAPQTVVDVACVSPSTPSIALAVDEAQRSPSVGASPTVIAAESSDEDSRRRASDGEAMGLFDLLNDSEMEALLACSPSTELREHEARWDDFMNVLSGHIAEDEELHRRGNDDGSIVDAGRSSSTDVPEGGHDDRASTLSTNASNAPKPHVKRASLTVYSLKDLIRSGVPARHRSDLWMRIRGDCKRDEMGTTAYDELVSQCRDWDDPVCKSIALDVDRTFPCHPFFATQSGTEQLSRLLTAFAKRCPSVGYTQSMNFVAAELLLVMPGEADAFVLFCALMEDLLPPAYYTDCMEDCNVDQAVVQAMLRQRLPKLMTHLDRLGLNSDYVKTVLMHWFLTLYADVLPQTSLVPVWDLLISEGIHVLFWVALALFEANQRALLECSTLEDAFVTLRTMTKAHNVPQWMSIALGETMPTMSDIESARDLVRDMISEDADSFPRVPDGLHQRSGRPSRGSDGRGSAGSSGGKGLFHRLRASAKARRQRSDGDGVRSASSSSNDARRGSSSRVVDELRQLQMEIMSKRDQWGFERHLLALDAGEAMLEFRLRERSHLDMVEGLWQSNRARRWTPTSQVTSSLRKVMRCGVPPSRRPALWRACCGARELQAASPDVYAQLLRSAKREGVLSQDIIDADVMQTFRDNVAFVSGEAQPALRNVLMAICKRHEGEWTYAVPLNLIAATLLLFMHEEDAFWVLEAMMCNVLPPHFFQGQFLGLGVFEDLLRVRLPSLHRHLAGMSADGALSHVTARVVEWLHVLFVGLVPMDTTVRCWDAMFCDGALVLLKMAVVMIASNEARLIACTDVRSLVQALHAIPSECTDYIRIMNAVHREKLPASIMTRLSDWGHQ